MAVILFQCFLAPQRLDLLLKDLPHSTLALVLLLEVVLDRLDCQLVFFPPLVDLIQFLFHDNHFGSGGVVGYGFGIISRPVGGTNRGMLTRCKRSSFLGEVLVRHEDVEPVLVVNC